MSTPAERPISIEHILAVEPDCAHSTPRFAFGWGFRIPDTYRWWALKHVLAGLKGRLLDFGCGAKPFSKALRHDGIVEWVGIDLDVRTSGTTFNNHADVFFDQGKVPFPAGSFDIVLSTQVLEHVEDLGQALSEIARVLSTGGVLVATVPLLSPLHEAPFDFRRFTPYGMRAEGLKHGLRLRRSIALGGPISSLATLAALHTNPLEKIPVVGKPMKRVLIEALTRSGLWLEALAYRAGLRQCSICFDYLFVLERL